MSTKTKTGLFIGTDGDMRRVQIDPTRGLRDYYELIETDIVERVDLKIAGYSVETWCDEEGLMRANPERNRVAQRITGYPLVGHVVMHGRSLDKVMTLLEDRGLFIHGLGAS